MVGALLMLEGLGLVVIKPVADVSILMPVLVPVLVLVLELELALVLVLVLVLRLALVLRLVLVFVANVSTIVNFEDVKPIPILLSLPVLVAIGLLYRAVVNPGLLGLQPFVFLFQEVSEIFSALEQVFLVAVPGAELLPVMGCHRG